ncbi:hypothetical protein ABEF95_010935 [Exophiala dermatitidis]
MRSSIAVLVAAFLATAVQCFAEPDGGHGLVHHKSCAPKAGDCSNCGADYVLCGTATCYNPKAGETCCQNQYACAANFNCSSTGPHCIPKNGGKDCDKSKTHTSTTTTAASAVPTTTSSSTSVSSSAAATITTSAAATASPVALVMSAPDDSNITTTYTTTVTLYTTNCVTVSATSGSSCSLSGATTGLPLTTSSMVPYGNSTTVALNTTTSTLSVANVTAHSTGQLSPKPTASISPPISGYKGAASGVQGQSSTSLFALGCFIYMAALLI